MPLLNIAVVEDELLIAESIINTLEEIGYKHCGPAMNYTEAIELLETKKPDLMLLDIQLSGKKDGIDVAAIINAKYKLPFIFLTANSDDATLERAKGVNPNAFIVKPFSKEDLHTAIEIAISNFTKSKVNATGISQEQAPTKDFNFYKDGQNFHKVFYNDIIYIESDNNYTTLFCPENRMIIVRSAFSSLLESLPGHLFARVHRRYAVNLAKVSKVEMLDVIVGDKTVPIGKSNREEFLKKLGI